MMSSTALRLGTFGRLALRNPSISVAVRSSSSSSGSENPIQKAHDLFNSPDRDYVNFPDSVQPVNSPPVRLGFVPETWFQAMYPKTGVTGPYLFGAGLAATLISKEIWVVDHGFTEVICFATAVTIAVKKLGPFLTEYVDKINEKREDIMFKQPIREAKASDEKFIQTAEETIAAQDGQKFLYQAKRENVDLQLEAIYRQRLADVHTAVKNRLDHQLETQNAKIRHQQTHMTSWIVDNVIKSITPQQEQESIKKCLADLKSMAARA